MNSTHSLAQKCSAEFIGTFVMVFAGCGAISASSLGHGGVCAVFGLAVACMVFATGHISGAHFNPAVSLAFLSAGFFPKNELVPYVLAQVLGAVLAAFLIAMCIGPIEPTMTSYEISSQKAFILECLLGFFLMFVISAVATDPKAQRSHAAIAIGSIVAVGALVVGPLTGASMNPARSLGPAIAAGEFQQIMLYLSAPCIGAVIAIQSYQRIAKS